MLRFIKMTAFAGVPFGLLMGLFFTFRSVNPFAVGPFGLVLGLAAGLLFGLLTATFAAWQRSRFTREDPCLEDEQLLKQGPANHFLGLEGVGGWLYLTDKRLLFRSHRFNVQNHEVSMPLDEIVEAQVCPTAWIIPNGLRVVTTQKAERFVVEGRRTWVAEISRVKGQAAEPGAAPDPAGM
jgi:hypothetical protein